MKKEELSQLLSNKVKEEEKSVKKPRNLSEEDKKLNLQGGRYIIGKMVSSGMIGIVYLARDYKLEPFNGQCCIKMMMGEKMAEKNIFASIRRELQILMEIRKIKGCINLTNIYWNDDSLNLVFPYYPKGDLYHHFKCRPGHTLPQNAVQKIARQLVTSLVALHKKGIIHRDIKPENILIDDDLEVFLSDFGFAIKK